MIKKLITFTLWLVPIFSFGADIYDPILNVLKINEVLVGKRIYKNVSVNVGQVVSVKSGKAEGTQDVYSADSNQLFIPSVQVGDSTYTNVTILVGPVLSIGGFINTGKMGGVSSIPITKQIWDKYWKTADPFVSLSNNGFNYYKVWYSTNRNSVLANTPMTDWSKLGWNNDFMWSLDLSIGVMKRAQASGMRVIANPFLSDVPQHIGSQSNPAIWKGFTLEETAEAIRQYSYESTMLILSNGIKVEYYQLNAESDKGFLDFSLGKNIPYPTDSFFRNITYMKEKVWLPNSVLYKAAIEGIKKADPNAKFAIQAVSLGGSEGNLFLKAFFKSLMEFGVQLDYFGLTYPYHVGDFGGEKFLEVSTPYFETNEYVETIKYLYGLGKPIIFSEFGYPNSTAGMGNGGAFNGKSDVGFPFTPKGQADWLRKFIDHCNKTTEIHSCLYFYPEYFPGMSYGTTIDLESNGLFAADGVPHPGLLEFNK